MDHDKKNNIDDEIAMIVLAILSIVIIAPIVIFKVVQSEPEVFQHLTIKESTKKSSVVLSFSMILGVIVYMYPELGEITLFHIGKVKFHAQAFIFWLVANLILGALTYLTIPIWKSTLNHKKNLKDQLY